MPPRDARRRQDALQRIAQIRDQIARLEYLCSGTLLRRWKVCGKPQCRCAQDPSSRHGPYYEWSRREGNRLAHTSLSAEEARQVAQAIRNYRRLRALLRKWERQSLRAIRADEAARP